MPPVLAVLPFLVRGALSLEVVRRLVARGLDVHVGYFMESVAGYSADPCSDLRAEGRLFSLAGAAGQGILDRLVEEVAMRRIGIVLQIGAPWAYRQLPYLKQAEPRLRIADVLYNEVGHTLNHFLYERCFDGVIVESAHMQRFVEERSLKPDPAVHVAESGVDLARFAFGLRRSRPGGPVIGYLGRMSPEKNPLGFVELARALHPMFPAIRFRLFGEGPLTDQVRAAVEAAGLGEALRFEGFATDLLDAYRQIDVLVVPSRLDGRPVAVMEANSCGIPVIGAPVGAIPEMIEPGRNGFLAAPGDLAAFAGILTNCICLPDRLAALSAASRRYAETRFDHDGMIDRYAAILGELAERPAERTKRRPGLVALARP